jgi:hypothetical protein
MGISGTAWLRSATARARRSLAVSVGVGAAIAALAYGALPAEGETGGSPTEIGTSSPGTGTSNCPSSNPPNQMTLVAGTPQSAPLGSVFATNLQVAFTNGNGCPVTTAVAGIPVTFSAPSAGASGRFSASRSNTVTVGSDATGTAAAPMVTATGATGGYTVIASSAYGSVSFGLTNVEAGNSSACGTLTNATASTGEEPAGKPTRLTLGVGATQSAVAGTRFPISLTVTVTDAEKNPVPGEPVTFTAPNRGPSGYFTVSSGAANTLAAHTPRSRTLHPRRVEVKTDACGIALAPAFTANQRDGGYVVLASVEHVQAAFALVNEGQ